MLILNLKTPDNGGSERQETLIGKVQKNDFLPKPTGFSLNTGIKEPPSEERKRYYRNSSSVSQVSAVQAQTSASCCRTPSDCSDRILRHCGRFKNSSNRVPVHKTVMGIKIPRLRIVHGKTIEWRGMFRLGAPNLISISFHRNSFLTRMKTKAPQKYNEFPKHARNVNFVLTFRKQQNLRKIAANKNMRLCNVLINNTLHDNSILILSQIEIFAIFSGLPP